MGREGSQKDKEKTNLKSQTPLKRKGGKNEKARLSRRKDNWQPEKKVERERSARKGVKRKEHAATGLDT